MNDQLSYCGQIVREHDPDRLLISLFAPTDRREAVWALFAFNYEIAKTREVVSEAQLGQIRLQWWREAIAKIYDSGEVMEHEILKALAPAIKNYGLPRTDFETLIYAREFDLETVSPTNIDGLMNYADFTGAPLMNMAVRISGGDVDYEPVHPVAVNYALMGLLRAVPFFATQRRCYLPEELMKQHGVSMNKLYDFLKPEEGIREVAKEVAAHFVKNIKPENKILRAAQTLAEIYRRQLERNKYDLFSPRLAAPPAFKALRVWMKSLT